MEILGEREELVMLNSEMNRKEENLDVEAVVGDSYLLFFTV